MTPDQLKERWKKSPVTFVEDIYGVSPDPWQREALEAIAVSNRLTIRSGHGVGKTALMSWICRWFQNIHDQCLIPCTAPTSHQLKNVLFAEIARWMAKEPSFLRDKFDVTSGKIAWKETPDASFAVARTSRAEKPEALQGFHHENLLFLIDEASGVPDPVFEAGQGALSTKGAKIVMAGNPTRTQGYFFDSHNRMRDLWYVMRVSGESSPRVDHEFIESLKTQYGADSNAYRIRVLGEFPTGDDDATIPYDWVLSAIERDVEVTDSPIIWGLDPARFGDDRSCLAKRQGNHLLEPIKDWRNKSSTQLAGIITNAYFDTPKTQRPVWINVDSIGIGAGVFDRLKENGIPVRAVNVAESPAFKEKFMRLRDELWWMGREWFESRSCKLPDDQGLISELSSPNYQITPAGKVLVESKSDVKKRTMDKRSPDKADAFLLTFYAERAAKSQKKPLVYPKRMVA